MYRRLLWRSAAQALGNMHDVRSSSTRLQAFFDVKFCRRIQLTVRILSRPTLSVTVTETVVKAQGILRWETETMEVESGSHRGQTILLSAPSTWKKAPTVATQLSLALQQIRRFHSR